MNTNTWLLVWTSFLGFALIFTRMEVADLQKDSVLFEKRLTAVETVQVGCGVR